MKRESKDVETDGRKKKRNIKEKRQVRGRRHRGGFLVSEFIFETDPRARHIPPVCLQLYNQLLGLRVFIIHFLTSNWPHGEDSVVLYD